MTGEAELDWLVAVANLRTTRIAEHLNTQLVRHTFRSDIEQRRDQQPVVGLGRRGGLSGLLHSSLEALRCETFRFAPPVMGNILGFNLSAFSQSAGIGDRCRRQCRPDRSVGTG